MTQRQRQGREDEDSSGEERDAEKLNRMCWQHRQVGLGDPLDLVGLPAADPQQNSSRQGTKHRSGHPSSRRVRSQPDHGQAVCRDEGERDHMGKTEQGQRSGVGSEPAGGRPLERPEQAVLRRCERDAGGQSRAGDLVIDRAALTVTKNGRPIGLTPTEMRMLLELSGSPGRVFGRQQLLQAVWACDYLGDSRLVDARVQRLRSKVEDTPSTPAYIQTARGFGYRFGPL